jgi:hypothetical protein
VSEGKQEILTFDAGLQASYGSASDKLHAICRS